MLNIYNMLNMINKTPQKKYPVIGFQVNPVIVRKVDRLAKAKGISRSDVLRLIVESHFQNGNLPIKLID